MSVDGFNGSPMPLWHQDAWVVEWRGKDLIVASLGDSIFDSFGHHNDLGIERGAAEARAIGPSGEEGPGILGALAGCGAVAVEPSLDYLGGAVEDGVMVFDGAGGGEDDDGGDTDDGGEVIET